MASEILKKEQTRKNKSCMVVPFFVSDVVLKRKWVAFLLPTINILSYFVNSVNRILENSLSFTVCTQVAKII